MAIKSEVPNDHTDPFWTQLASNAEVKADLPVGMLQTIISHGERSNNDQVSEKGARSPFQIIPATRTQAIKKWGIDPYLSPENAAEVSALLLKDSLNRNKGDINEAVGEYHGGTDRKNWGPRTRAYQSRVADGMESKQADRILAHLEEQYAQQPKEESKRTEPSDLTNKFNTPQEDALSKFLDDRIASGHIKIQSNVTDPEFIHPTEKPGMIAELKDSVTGDLRKVPATEALPTLDKMPELRDSSDPSAWRAILGKLTASPEESAQIMQANFPNVKVKNDEKGNFIFTSPTDGKDYAIHPGLEWGDLPRIGAEALLFGKGAALKGVSGAVLGGAGAQSTMEGIQAASGGEFDPHKVAEVALMAGAPGIVKDAYGAAKGGLSKVVGNRVEAQAANGARSASAAATPMETQRVVLGESLPIPIKNPTKGQITNNQAQQAFEKNIAKQGSDEGTLMRDRFEEHNGKLAQNLDHMVDDTGINISSNEAMGNDLSNALADKQDIAKRIVNEHYTTAEASPEADKLVKPKQLVNFLNLNKSEIKVSPSMTSARDRLIDIGGATKDANGYLVAKEIPLKDIHSIRVSTNAVMKSTGSDSHYGDKIKETIDDIFDKNGGQLYKNAAVLRREQGKIFTDKESVKNILASKFTSGDRKIALEKVFQKSILGGSNEDIKHIRRTLTTNRRFRQHMSQAEIDATSEHGIQAWNNIQGMMAQHIKDEAFRNTARNTKGELIISAPALTKTIRNLDKDGKLEAVFGVNKAQTFRDIEELASTLMQSPPGTVNGSDTATILMAAMDGGLSSLIGLPLPILSGLKIVVKRMKNAKLRAKVNEALNHHHVIRPQRNS